MVLKEWAKAAWSQLAGPDHIDAGGAIHGVVEGDLGEAPASMVAGGRGSPPGAWNGHMEIRPDHGLWKDGQGAPRGADSVVLPPRPPPRPPPRRRRPPRPPHPRSARGEEDREVMTVVAGQDGAEEWQREQSSRMRILGRRWTQAGGPE